MVVFFNSYYKIVISHVYFAVCLGHTCRNGDCLTAQSDDVICDDEPDCIDGSDESDCVPVELSEIMFD